jgi:hypothetical protein
MYLWSLRLDFAGTGQRAVDFTHCCGEDSAGDKNFCFVLLFDGSNVLSVAGSCEVG